MLLGSSDDQNFDLPTSSLVTHGLIVGMTGSGKTGLGIVALEEAALAGVSTIVIDLKGDMTNLALQPGHPSLNALSIDNQKHEQRVADAGLWQRAERLRKSGQWTIYTPGSEAGQPVAVLRGLAAPANCSREDMAEQCETVTTAILTLAGIDADPIQSRAHILVASIVAHQWGVAAGRTLTLDRLISLIIEPPMRHIGAFEIDDYCPPKERKKLAGAMNSLVASPSFALWRTGQPLDLSKMLEPKDGRPQHALFYLAHLDDQDRQFFLTLLLNEVVAYMRRQSGTTALRTLLYCDEVSGLVPPVQNPPTKRPLMTLLRQGRAFGIGVLLATQNPVDLDYKAMSNTGTWFIGRLQTERDRQRLLDGMSAAGADAAGIERRLVGLRQREFVVHSVHSPDIQQFTSRQSISRLAGPLSKHQVDVMRRKSKPPETIDLLSILGVDVSEDGHIVNTKNAVASRSVEDEDVPTFRNPKRR